MSGRTGLVKRKKAISKSQRANVLFPVGRLHRYLKTGTPKYRIGIGAAVYAASVIEYLTAEVLELAGNTARDSKKTRITPRHILFAIATDKELHDLLHSVTIPSGGVLPHIHPSLFGKKKSGSSLPPFPGLPKTPVPPPSLAANKPGAKTVKTAAQLKDGTSGTGTAPLKVRAKRLTMLHLPPSAVPVVLSEKKLFLGQTLTVVKQDLMTVSVDAIVHPTSAHFSIAGEIGQALEKVVGPNLKQEVADFHQKTGCLARCEVAAMASSNTPFPWIIHVNGPGHNEVNAYDKLETSVKNCLVLADLKNFKCIALPSIGSGRAGFPKQQAAQTILKSIRNYFTNVMSSSLKQIYFVLYDRESISAYTSELDKLVG